MIDCAGPTAAKGKGKLALPAARKGKGKGKLALPATKKGKGKGKREPVLRKLKKSPSPAEFVKAHKLGCEDLEEPPNSRFPPGSNQILSGCNKILDKKCLLAVRAAIRGGGTSLHAALAIDNSKSCTQTMKELLEAGADMSLADDSGQVPLSLLCASGRVTEALFLLEQSGLWEPQGPCLNRHLLKAAAAEAIDCSEPHSQLQKANQSNVGTSAAFHLYSSEGGFVEDSLLNTVCEHLRSLCQLLLPKANLKEEPTVWAVCSYAFKLHGTPAKGKTDWHPGFACLMAELALEAGADADLRGPNGLTPLMAVCKAAESPKQRAQMVAVLLKYGAAVEARSIGIGPLGGITALGFCASPAWWRYNDRSYSLSLAKNLANEEPAKVSLYAERMNLADNIFTLYAMGASAIVERLKSVTKVERWDLGGDLQEIAAELTSESLMALRGKFQEHCSVVILEHCSEMFSRLAKATTATEWYLATQKACAGMMTPENALREHGAKLECAGGGGNSALHVFARSLLVMEVAGIVATCDKAMLSSRNEVFCNWFSHKTLTVGIQARETALETVLSARIRDTVSASFINSSPPKSAPVGCRDYLGPTELVKSAQMECVLTLLQAKDPDDKEVRALCRWKALDDAADKESAHATGDTFLIFALRQLQAEQIQRLIFEPTNGLVARARAVGCVDQLFQVDNEGCTPLMHAICKGIPAALLDQLIDAHDDLNVQSRGQHSNALMLAFGHNSKQHINLEAGIQLVNTGRLDLSQQESRGFDALITLIISCSGNLTKCRAQALVQNMQLLIDHDADVSLRDKQTGRTALHWVCSIRQSAKHTMMLPVVECLVQAGAPINAKTKAGDTPLMVALATPGHSLEIEYLLEWGADPNQENWEQDTPLGRAVCLFNDTQPIKSLLDAHASIDRKLGSQGKLGTALCVAGRHGCLRAFQTLLDYGADVNATDCDGESAIFTLVESPSLSTIREVVAAKAGSHDMKYLSHYETIEQDLHSLLPSLCEQVVSHSDFKDLPSNPARERGGQSTVGMPWEAAAAGSEHFSVREWSRLRGSFLGRYTSLCALHKSATCSVWAADDLLGGGQRVALKIMEDHTQVERELSTRDQSNFDQQYCVDILRVHIRWGNCWSVATRDTNWSAIPKEQLDAAQRPGLASSMNSHPLSFMPWSTERQIHPGKGGNHCLSTDLRFQRLEDAVALCMVSPEAIAVRWVRDCTLVCGCNLVDCYVVVGPVFCSEEELQELQEEAMRKEDSRKRREGVEEVEDSASITWLKEELMEGLTGKGDEYVLVMPLAEQSLWGAMGTERICGVDVAQVQTIGRSLALCIDHLHSKGVLHGDIKPRNACLFQQADGQQRYTLIDLDCAALLGQPCGLKYSSGYIPPELAALVFAVGAGSEHQLLPEAHPSYDIWSLGALLYELCTGFSFLPKDVADDRLLQHSEDTLISWTELPLEALLSVFKDETAGVRVYACDLLSWLTQGDPKHRPQNMGMVLNHPFLSCSAPPPLPPVPPGLASSRLLVVFSYQSTQSALLRRLRRYLNSLGISTADGMQVPPGEDWRAWYFQRLQHCCVFVPCLSSQFAHSSACGEEVVAAVRQGKPIIPAVFDAEPWQALIEHTPAGSSAPLVARLNSYRNVFNGLTQIPASGNFETDFFDSAAGLVEAILAAVPAESNIQVVVIAAAEDQVEASHVRELFCKAGVRSSIAGSAEAEAAWNAGTVQIAVPVLSAHFPRDLQVSAQLAKAVDTEDIFIPLLPILADFDGYQTAMSASGLGPEDRVRMAWLKSYLNRCNRVPPCSNFLDDPDVNGNKLLHAAKSVLKKPKTTSSQLIQRLPKYWSFFSATGFVPSAGDFGASDFGADVLALVRAVAGDSADLDQKQLVAHALPHNAIQQDEGAMLVVAPGSVPEAWLTKLIQTLAARDCGIKVSTIGINSRQKEWFEACEHSAYCIAVLNQGFLESQWCEGQLTYAKDNGKGIVYLMHDSTSFNKVTNRR